MSRTKFGRVFRDKSGRLVRYAYREGKHKVKVLYRYHQVRSSFIGALEE